MPLLTLLLKKYKNVERNLNKLEQKLLNIKALSRGVLTQEAMSAGCTLTVLKDYLNRNSVKNDTVLKNMFKKTFVL